MYDQLHSRPKHPTVQINSTPSPELKPDHAPSSINAVDLSLPPTRTHWLTDDLATNCMACGLKFSVFTRKHHCRKCGFIFCSECSKFNGKLDSKAQFNSLGYSCRLCISCSQEYMITLNGNTSSDTGLIDAPSVGTLSIKIKIS